MTTRWAKVLVIASVALYYTLVVIDNLTDFNSNYEFVRHVLLMDSTFAGNHGMWRSIHSTGVYLAFYWAIIVWESASAILAWWGAASLFRARGQTAATFNAEKRIAVIALTVSLLLWLVAFLDIGGEWFMMWQSPTWNGQQEAFRMFAVTCLALLLVLQTDAENQV